MLVRELVFKYLDIGLSGCPVETRFSTKGCDLGVYYLCLRGFWERVIEEGLRLGSIKCLEFILEVSFH